MVIGDKSLNIDSGFELSNDELSKFKFSAEALSKIIRFTEKHAFSDRLIFKNKISLSRPRKTYVRTEFTEINDIMYIVETAESFSGFPKIYDANDITFKELLHLQTENKEELFKKNISDVRLKQVIGEKTYSNWKKECLAIHVSALCLGLLEFHFLNSFIAFPFFLWISFGLWLRKRLKVSKYNLVVFYFLFLLPLYIFSILIASYITSPGSNTMSELSFMGSTTGAIFFLSIHFIMVRLYLHFYTPSIGEKNKNELQQRLRKHAGPR